ncbi:alpha/beta hydrolase [Curtobacterium sp. Leaf261]|uniref:alpha/beta hydrolase n=1 Tax=Curtobacterium sp. Leaf261 TaxID=1736311 RepID=UPI0006FC30BF|nr:alpha/beta hydrolase [Curtobacterium sp. Leaf261]KQO60051.1 alpha/beta hydrolase [Curtobacterium sp. Leaf261]
MELIFVHGALVRDGDWWWRPTAELLLERTGIRSRSVALPSCGETTPEDVAGGLVADAGALRAELDTVDDAIVVAHSYGGTVVAEAGHHPAVRHLLLVSSYLPDVGQAQGQIMSGESDPVAIGDAGDGRLGVVGYSARTFGDRFLQDTDDTVQAEGFARVAPQAAASFTTPTTAAGWQGVDSTSLVCVDDRSTSVALQRFHAERATRSEDVPTGHHPFISRPDIVTDTIERMLR